MSEQPDSDGSGELQDLDPAQFVGDAPAGDASPGDFMSGDQSGDQTGDDPEPDPDSQEDA